MASESKFYEMTGIVHKVLDEQTFSSGFRKRDLVLTDDIGSSSKYPKYVPFTFKKDRADLLGGVREGQRVKVVFALDGREHNGKYYPDITGIKVEVLSQANDYTNAPEPAEPPPDAVPYSEVQDDMPF